MVFHGLNLHFPRLKSKFRVPEDVRGRGLGLRSFRVLCFCLAPHGVGLIRWVCPIRCKISPRLWRQKPLKHIVLLTRSALSQKGLSPKMEPMLAACVSGVVLAFLGRIFRSWLQVVDETVCTEEFFSWGFMLFNLGFSRFHFIGLIFIITMIMVYILS